MLLRSTSTSYRELQIDTVLICCILGLYQVFVRNGAIFAKEKSMTTVCIYSHHFWGSVEAGKLQRISGANKRCWKHVEDGPERTWKSVASQSTSTPNEAKTGVVA